MNVLEIIIYAFIIVTTTLGASSLIVRIRR